MSDPLPTALRFHNADTLEDLGQTPCRAGIPAAAWRYAVNSNPIDFAAFQAGAWVRLLLTAHGDALVGVSIMNEVGSNLLTTETAVGAEEGLRSVIMYVGPEAGIGLVLLRNYGTGEKSGCVDLLEAEILPCDHPKGRLLKAILPIFDAEWYAAQHPDVDWSRHSPLPHYLDIGAVAGADPSPFFDSRWYIDAYSVTPRDGATAVEHYLSTGAALGYEPSPIFDSQWYLDLIPALKTAPLSPLEHFLNFGRHQGMLPNAHFDGFLADAVEERKAAEGGPCWDKKHLEVLPGGLPGQALILPLKQVFPYAAAHGDILYAGSAGTQERSLEDGPPRYIARLNNVVIQGGGDLIVTPDGDGLHDELWHTDRHFPTDMKSHSIARLPGQRMLLRIADRFAPSLESGIHLMTETDANYFHWVAEVLSRLFLLQDSGVLQTLPPATPLLLTDDLDDRLVEMISYLLPAERPVLTLKRGQLYKIKDLVFAGPVARVLNNCFRQPDAANTYLPIDLLQRMAGAIRQAVPSVDQTRRRRVYLHRGGASRLLTNQSELQDRLIELGFEVLDPAKLSAKAQIQLFSQCDRIIAPTGAALTNMLWCNPGTRVTVLYCDHVAINPGIWDALAQAAACVIDHMLCPRTHDVVGKYSASDNFTFPMEWFPELL